MALVSIRQKEIDLISSYRVRGYYLYDENETEVASVKDLLIDEELKIPRYVLIEVGGLLAISGRRILIPWGALRKGGMSRLNVRKNIEEIIAAPVAADPSAPTQVEEESIHRYFDIEPYWIDNMENEKKKEDE
jgi:hypothetical protein